MDTTTTDEGTRLAALELALPRFKGRAAALKAAGGLRWTANPAEWLSALETLAQHGIRAVEIKALRGELAADVAKTLAGPALKAQTELRAKREALAVVVDQLATRRPGGTLERVALDRARDAIDAAGFRTTTHGHETTVALVAPGQETVVSATSSARPGDVGLPSAYSRKGFWVTTSAHEWSVSTEVLAVDRASREVGGLVYLSLTTRVRQGRGTALVTERLTASASGRMVWR